MKALAGYIMIGAIMIAKLAKGQDGYSLADSYVGLSVGVAAPLGQSNSTSSSDWSGHAAYGYDLNLSAGIDLYHSYGVAAMLGYYKNKYKMAEFITDLSNASPAVYSDLRNNSYQAKVFLMGLFKTMRIKNNTWCDFRLMAGLMISDYPNPRWTITSSGSSSNWSVNVLETSAFAIDLGVGWRYYFGKRIFGLLNLDFLYANPTYSGTLNSDSPTPYSEIISGKITMAYLTFNAGIGYQLFMQKP